MVLFDKSLRAPLARPPASHKDDAADVLVEGKAYPHAHQAVTKRNADDVAEADGYAPLEDDADDEGIEGVARGAQGAAGKDVRCAPDFQEDIDYEYPDAHRDDFGIVGEGCEDGPPENGEGDRACQRDNHGPAEEIVAEDIGCLLALLTDKMPHENVAALCDAQTEEIDEHNHVVAVGSGGQRLVANLVDEESDDYLRQAVGDVLAHGWYADVQQVSQLLPGDRAEIVDGEAGYMHAEVDDGQQNHGDGPAGSSGDGCTLNAQLRTAPVTEDECIVA